MCGWGTPEEAHYRRGMTSMGLPWTWPLQSQVNRVAKTRWFRVGEAGGHAWVRPGQLPTWDRAHWHIQKLELWILPGRTRPQYQ